VISVILDLNIQATEARVVAVRVPDPPKINPVSSEDESFQVEAHSKSDVETLQLASGEFVSVFHATVIQTRTRIVNEGEQSETCRMQATLQVLRTR